MFLLAKIEIVHEHKTEKTIRLQYIIHTSTIVTRRHKSLVKLNKYRTGVPC